MSVCVRVSCLCVCVCVSCVCVRVCEWKNVRPTNEAMHQAHPLDHPPSLRSSLSFPSCPHFGRVLSRCEGDSGELQHTATH